MADEKLIADIRRESRVYRQLTSAKLRLGNQLSAIDRSMKPRKRKKGERPPLHPISKRDLKRAAEAAKGLLSVPLEYIEAAQKKQARILAALGLRLPVWEAWASQQRGFGALGLALIIGETGALDWYERDSQVCKRLGLAVFDGVAQGRVPKHLVGADRTEAWIARGYSPIRRSVMFVQGRSLIMQNGAGPYRKLYLSRKKIEARKLKDAPKKGRAAWIDRRAQRYMEKRFLRDLWRAWRDAEANVRIAA